MNKQRVTILNHEKVHDNAIDKVNTTYLSLNDFNHSREDKFTLNYSFKYIRQLRISIGNYDSGVLNYNSVNLNVNVVPYTPQKYLFFNEINEFLNEMFGLNVGQDNWIISKNSLYFHSDKFDTRKFNEFLTSMTKQKISNFDAVDLKYEHKLIISVLNGVEGPIVSEQDYHKEVGLFLEDENSSENDIILSGVRVILEEEKEAIQQGPDKKNMHKTLFHIDPRYRKLEATSELISNGLHPKVKFGVAEYPKNDDLGECKLYYYQNLPNSVFIDKYNLGENLKLVVNFGSQDLELPSYKVNEWGNEILLEVTDLKPKTYELNLHSRYQMPNSTIEPIALEGPTILYGCEDSNEKSTALLNPFINEFGIGGGYTSFFTDDTKFYQAIMPPMEVKIPSPQLPFEYINSITQTVLLLGIVMIVMPLLKFPKRKKE